MLIHTEGNYSFVNDFLEGSSLACSSIALVDSNHSTSCMFTSWISGTIISLFVCVFALQVLETTEGWHNCFSKNKNRIHIKPRRSRRMTQDASPPAHQINNCLSPGEASALQDTQSLGTDEKDEMVTNNSMPASLFGKNDISFAISVGTKRSKTTQAEEIANSMLTRLQNEKQHKATKNRKADVRIISIYAPLAICTLLGNFTTFPSNTWQGTFANLSMIAYTMACAKFALATAQATANFRYILHIDPSAATSDVQGLSSGDARVLRRAQVSIRVMWFIFLILWVCCTFAALRRSILIGGCKLTLFVVWVGEVYFVGAWQISVIKEVARVHRKALSSSVKVSIRRERIVRLKMLDALGLILTNVIMAFMQLAYFVSLAIFDSHRFVFCFSIELILLLLMGLRQTWHAIRRMRKNHKLRNKKTKKPRPYVQSQCASSFSEDIMSHVQYPPTVGLFEECEIEKNKSFEAKVSRKQSLRISKKESY